MTDSVDPTFFKELSDKDPTDVCRRALCQYDRTMRSYTLSVWGEEIVIIPHQQKIECTRNGRLEAYLNFFAIHYLLGATVTDISNTWISEKEIPGGVTFFRGPHRIPTECISSRFENALDEFSRWCERLGGDPLSMADAAYRFEIVSRIPAAVLFWRGDDDFPAEAKILFDRTITDHLATDVIYALAVAICERLGHPPTAIT